MEQSSVLKSAKVLNPRNCPERDDEEGTVSLAEYGIEEINVLIDHFSVLLEGKDFNTEQAQRQWLEIKVVQSRRHLPHNYTMFWAIV